jgi:hypothetical protein
MGRFSDVANVPVARFLTDLDEQPSTSTRSELGLGISDDGGDG